MSLHNNLFRDFSGGVNTRDSETELGENEVPSASNVTIDERGAAMKRLGYARRYSDYVGSQGRTLNGTNQYFTATDSASLDFGNVFTIECFIKRGTASSGVYTILEKGSTGPFLCIDTSHRIQLLWNGVADSTSGFNTITDTTTWHHVMVAHDGTDTWIYKDGVDVTTNITLRTFTNNAVDLNVGRTSSGGSFFNGSIAHLSIYGTVLSPARVAAHYAARTSLETYRSTVLSDSPLMYTTLNLPSANGLLDLTANANNLTAFNSPTATVGPVTPEPTANLFYWAARDWDVAQVGRTMHINGGDPFHEWTTTARCGMAEFSGNLVMIHPVDGLKVYDGATVTSPAGAPKGTSVATWQNKCWANDSFSVARVWFCAAGDITSWPGTNWVDIREKDSTAVTCLSGASGLDISGRPGLLVFKQDSTYRIHDSSNGSYTSVDASIGCGSAIAAVNAYGRTYVASTRGIYSTDGLEPMREETQLIENFFNKNIINQTRPDLFCAGRYQDRLWFSFPLVGATANGKAIELHPLQHWVMPHTCAASCYSSRGRNVTDMVFGSPTAGGMIYTSHTGGSDDGVAITSSLRTRWMILADGNKARIRRLRFVGFGQVMAAVLTDYQTAAAIPSLSVNLTGSSINYDSGYLYDSGNVYGPASFQNTEPHWSVGVAREVSIEITETSSLTQTGQSVLGGTAQIQGAWTLSRIEALIIDLGNV